MSTPDSAAMKVTKRADELSLSDVWWRKPSEPCGIIAIWFTSPACDEMGVRYRDPFTAPEVAKEDRLRAHEAVEVSDEGPREPGAEGGTD